ncbi:MAG TPA: hypothetical protein VKU00_09485 [Chthonomonadaceae bacterium]|nr:hypothetical protein [Chthonomonadaceae bacterium]
MSIPERFYRIARHKLNELRERFDQMDAEAQETPEEIAKRRRAEAKADAKRELDDVMANPAPSSASSSKDPDIPPYIAPLKRRTPEEIRRGTLSTSAGTSGALQNSQVDPLDFHYRRLGVESGSDFATVQAAYNKLIARADPGRFPAGSDDARIAEQIRQEIEASFKALRDELDTTARRFDLLEFDSPPPAPKAQSNP